MSVSADYLFPSRLEELLRSLEGRAQQEAARVAIGAGFLFLPIACACGESVPWPKDFRPYRIIALIQDGAVRSASVG